MARTLFLFQSGESDFYGLSHDATGVSIRLLVAANGSYARRLIRTTLIRSLKNLLKGFASAATASCFRSALIRSLLPESPLSASPKALGYAPMPAELAAGLAHCLDVDYLRPF